MSEQPASTPQPAARARSQGSHGGSKERRAGRVWAVQSLYAQDLLRYPGTALAPPADDDAPAPGEEAQLFGDALVAGLLARMGEIDAAIGPRLQNWTLARMAVIDRGLLRLGCFELLHRVETPVKVVINEYIELAKTFGSDARTAKLVNGVLDRIARDLRPANLPAATPATPPA